MDASAAAGPSEYTIATPTVTGRRAANDGMGLLPEAEAEVDEYPDPDVAMISCMSVYPVSSIVSRIAASSSPSLFSIPQPGKCLYIFSPSVSIWIQIFPSVSSMIVSTSSLCIVSNPSLGASKPSHTNALAIFCRISKSYFFANSKSRSS